MPKASIKLGEPSYKSNIEVDENRYTHSSVENSLLFSDELSFFNKEILIDKSNVLPPLAASVLGVDNTAAPFSENSQYYHCWSEIDAQEIYINSKPTCYLILSKPGSDEYSLGESMSKKINCVHLCPKNILMDEIDQQSPTGKCLMFNMKHNKVIKYDTIFQILSQKLQSPVVKHRGYVISGFPFVTSNYTMHYFIDDLYKEESLNIVEDLIFGMIYNLKKKKPKKEMASSSSVSSKIEIEAEEALEEEQEVNLDEEAAEEEPVVVELPKFLLMTCQDILRSKNSYIETKKSVLLKQLKKLLHLPIVPDVIIYISGPDEDVIIKRMHVYINYTNNNIVYEPFIANPNSELRWPCAYKTNEYTHPYVSTSFSTKYCCRQPNNFKKKSNEKLCNYNENAFPYIDKKLKEFDPKYIIKLDFRNTVHQMMHNLTENLILLPIKPILLPEPLYIEEPPEDLEEFWKSVEEINSIRDGIVTFNRYASPWYNRCPVELANRITVIGNPKFAVTLFQHVYLLSSLNAMILFYINPRPYLKLEYLEPICRIIIMGTKSSGKTMIAHSLSWLFDVPIIDFKEFFDTERKEKYENYSKTILSEIIESVEETRFKEWQSKENIRMTELDAWFTSTLDYLKKYTMLYNKLSQSNEDDEVYSELLTKINKITKLLIFLPFLDDLPFCNEILEDSKELLNFAPATLNVVTPKPTVPIIGDDDVTNAISDYIITNGLQNEIEPTVEEIMLKLSKILFEIDSRVQKVSGNEHIYGQWIIDDFPSGQEYWELLNDYKLLPDNTIVIIESREIQPELFKNYTKIDHIKTKNYEETFVAANDPLVKLKLLRKSLSDQLILNMQIIVEGILYDAFEIIFSNDLLEDVETELTKSMEMFRESIEKFRENWDNIKLKLEENSKSFIEIDIENKTDVEIVEEILLGLRQSYSVQCESTEDDEPEDQDETDETHVDFRTYNHRNQLCDTNLYCPIAYYQYGVLWKGKSEFQTKFNNKYYYFGNEEFLELFKKDSTKWQSLNKPYKRLPSLRICVMGCIGSGRTTLSKIIAKELGIMHIDFSEILNEYYLPKHVKKVGRQYENVFTDEPMDEEAVTDFQLDEGNQNEESEFMANDVELRKIIFNYFERGTPLNSKLLQKLLKKLWLSEPFRNTGFVLDGFPRLTTDVEAMITCLCIPDLVIELEGNSEISVERLSPLMYQTWKLQLIDAQQQAKMKLDAARVDWQNFITKKVVVQLIYDEILDNMFFTTIEPEKGISKESLIFDADPSGLSNIDANLFNTYNDLIKEYPEPINEHVWEKTTDARERIASRIESLFEVEDENIQTLKDILFEQKIPLISLDAKTSLMKLCRVILFKLLYLSNRNDSFFEQTFVINNEIAEMLLSEGFCFLSKFHRMCPVYIYENPGAILCSYKISKLKNKIFCTLHRCYLYFISNEENLKKFRRNPLKYIACDNIRSFIEYPLTISVLGPPKSGKSMLSANIARKYNLLCVSRGIAIRNILENFSWTKLASRINRQIIEGQYVDPELMAKAVQTILLDHRTTTYGFIFDGFPESPSEAMELVHIGVYPNIVLDIVSSKEKILENSQSEIYPNIIKRKPPYPSSFIQNRYTTWKKQSDFIRNWINNDVQNIYKVKGQSKWEYAHNANSIIKNIIPKIHHYLVNVNTKVVNVYPMCIPNDIFQKRMSQFKTLCPVCLRNNVLKHSNYPLDRKNIIQYNNIFYWICKDHINSVLKHPERYLLKRIIHIPEIPAVIKIIDTNMVYENGICIVTYAENLPSQKLINGNENYAATYNSKTYLFCSSDCLEKFLAKPHVYYDISVFKETTSLPDIILNKLPNLGYLEQSLGNILTQALCYVNVKRPKYPGLNVFQSAVICIALYLKTINPLTDKSYLPLYVKALKTYESTCKLILDVCVRFRTIDNPFVKYPRCCKSRETQKNVSFTELTSQSSNVEHRSVSFSDTASFFS